MPELSNANWRKSTRSGGNGGNCVEVATLNDTIGVRDSKNIEAGALVFKLEPWSTFLAAVKANRLTA
ncbi:DUF397 domain-containing protein [Micromonospora zhanjiangensis]|uniref:DUF397 domain-containing protein n=1 Tax=Micromonospora zhanjiangensis TaxID=1522057 RepID=A0ABV8KG97_9ACTN